NNKNGMVATFEDINGNTKGSLLGDMQNSCPAGAPTLPDGALVGTTYTYGAPCRNIASLGKIVNGVGLTSWSFKWTAPAAGAGTVYFYYGVVDGDASQTSLGDDVKMGKQQISEGP